MREASFSCGVAGCCLWVAFDLVEPYGNLWGIMGARASPEGTPKLPGNRKQPISNTPETKRQNSLGAKKKTVPACRHSP